MAVVDAPKPCPGCQVPPGYTHAEGCKVELCSNCLQPRHTCSCDDHNPREAFWTGWWPGAETVRLFDLHDVEQAITLARTRREALRA